MTARQWPNPEPEWTPRQREVLDFIARGYTNGQIAEALGIGFAGAKWHVSDLISRLGVSSREEVAAYWRQARSLRGRSRALGGAFFSVGAAKVAAGAVGLVAAVGITVAAVAIAGGGSDDPSSIAASTESTVTPTVGEVSPSPTTRLTPEPAASPTPVPSPTPSPTPVDVGFAAAFEALEFELVDFKADALHTSVSYYFEGSTRETGYPLVYVTDPNGYRVRLQGTGGAYTAGYQLAEPATATGPALSIHQGTFLIEILPVREYVRPVLGPDDPTPAFGRWEVDLDGQTSPLRELPLPEPARKPFGDGFAEITRILVTDDAARVEWTTEFEAGTEIYPDAAWFDASGEPGFITGGGGGESVIDGSTLWRRHFDEVPGTLTMLLRGYDDHLAAFCDNPVEEKTASGGTVITCDDPAPSPEELTLEHQRQFDGPVVEFEISFR